MTKGGDNAEDSSDVETMMCPTIQEKELIWSKKTTSVLNIKAMRMNRSTTCINNHSKIKDTSNTHIFIIHVEKSTGRGGTLAEQ